MRDGFELAGSGLGTAEILTLDRCSATGDGDQIGCGEDRDNPGLGSFLESFQGLQGPSGSFLGTELSGDLAGEAAERGFRY